MFLQPHRRLRLRLVVPNRRNGAIPAPRLSRFLDLSYSIAANVPRSRSMLLSICKRAFCLNLIYSIAINIPRS